MLPKNCIDKGFQMSDPTVTSVFHPNFGEIIFAQLTPETCQWLVNNGFTGLVWKPIVIQEPKKP